MKRYLFTSLAPNVERDDIVRSLWLFFTGQGSCKEGVREQLTSCIQDFFETKNVFAFESGRSALAALLMSLHLRPHDEVLLQAYTCVAVPNAILWAGGTPVYVDCRSDRPTMSVQDAIKKITPHTRALIVQHTFGIPADMDELMQVAKEHNLILIEDCAHTIGGEYKEKKLGTFGHAAIISFGRDKPISSIFGGAAIVHDASLGKQMEAFFAGLKSPSWVWTQRQLLQPFITALSKATYGIGIGKIFIRLALFFNILYPALTKKERIGQKPSFVFHKLPCALADLALRQWKKLERFNAHRKRLAAIYEDGLRGIQGIGTISLSEEEGTILLRYPILVDDPKGAHSFARARGIYLGDWYDSPVAPANVALAKVKYQFGSCKAAEALSKRTVNLPVSIGISEESARRIIVCMKSYIDSLKPSV